MKRIINGKRYDTATAEFICDVSPPYYGNDFRAADTNLYRTKRGTWFVQGSGGPRSRWAHQTGNGTTGGDGIQPIDAEEARDLLERYGDPSDIEKYFTVEDA